MTNIAISGTLYNLSLSAIIANITTIVINNVNTLNLVKVMIII